MKKEGVTRRKYIKYGLAGLVVAAGAAAGLYSYQTYRPREPVTIKYAASTMTSYPELKALIEPFVSGWNSANPLIQVSLGSLKWGDIVPEVTKA